MGVSLIYEKLGHSVIRLKNARGKWRGIHTNDRDAYQLEFPKGDPLETYESMEERAWALVREFLRTGEVECAVRTADSRITQGFLELDLDAARVGIFPEDSTNELRSSVELLLAEGKIPTISVSESCPGGTSSPFNTVYKSEQLILGGPEHLNKIIEIVDSARDDIFILSTFIASQKDLKQRENRELLWSALDRAAARGVRCHLFYGETGTGAAIHAEAIEELAKRLRGHSQSRQFVLSHLKSVHSHAKFLAADDGFGGAVVVVGSCNWLLSPFLSCELSVEMREAKAVQRGLKLFGAIISSSPEAALSIDHLRELASRVVRDQTGFFKAVPGNLEGIAAKMKIIYSHEHGPLLRNAAHTANGRIMVATAKLGAPMKPAIFNPFEAVDVDIKHVLYSRVSGPVKKRHARIEKEKHLGKIGTISLNKPELHAKFLLWGEDDLVVTSLNWGSKQGDAAAPYDEIGVHINAVGIVEDFLTILQEQWPEILVDQVI